MKFTCIFFLMAFIFLPCIAQTNENASLQFTFLPSGIHFQPLKANVQEPRLGVFKSLDVGNMKVDIGNTIDLAELYFPSHQSKFTIGIDFMAYAFVTNSQGLRLQIDAIDGFFGGNLSFSKQYEVNKLQARFRIIHHSAHLVDGHYNQSTNSWIDNRSPIPATQDLGEIVFAHNVVPSFGLLKYYGGFSYATLVRPSTIERISFLAGTEIAFDNIIGAVHHQPTNLFLAYHIDLRGTPEYSATHQLQLGIKVGNWNEKGITIFLGYYTGQHMFAEYFDQHLSTLGAGFTVDWY